MNHFNLYRKSFVNPKKIQNYQLQMHTRNSTAILTVQHLVLANMEDRIYLSENVNRALKVVRFTVHTGLKKQYIPVKAENGNIKFYRSWKIVSIRLVRIVCFTT